MPLPRLARLLARSHESLADALLDQAVLAGIGNVFKSEICFVQGMHPFRAVGTLTRDEATATIATAQKLLKANVLEDSGDLIVTFRGPAAAHYARIRSKRQPCGSMAARVSHAAAAESRFVAAFKARMRA